MPATSAHVMPTPVAVAARVRVLIADGDPLARRVVRDGLQATPGIVVPGEARTVVEAVELALHYRPELVLLETHFPGEDGIDGCRRIRADAPEVAVVVFTAAYGPEIAMRALRVGASGVLSKQTPIDAVARALQGVANGEAALSRAMTMQLISRLRRTASTGGMRPVRSTLTTREWEVLDLMTTGATTRTIIDTLVLSGDTVSGHVKSIMRKLGVHTRQEAVAAAARLRDPDLFELVAELAAV